ncbi:MAG TPA: twin-arginine translocase TatA/TatE family subunit [Kouleothrix sp.]|nr:twin-arginine translocase TatA/TatE family subunit [Kouleothrix sp.]HRC76146.1 twin-arginine translocase TatA/TatE family subunit [Kouleothrix sp.]
MEILGIGPGEFILILVVLLVVVGPERLPDLARQAGRLLVRGRNWLQSSPDAAMVLRARQEIEQELASLRTSLLEVQSVRDEVIGAARQIEESVESLTTAARTELHEIGSIAPPKLATPESPADAPAPPAEEPFKLPEAWTTYPTTQAPEPEPEPAPQAAPPDTLASIEVRLQAIMSDLFALQEQLRRSGALDASWQPPSWGVHLPAEGAPAPAAEPIATEEARP